MDKADKNKKSTDKSKETLDFLKEMFKFDLEELDGAIDKGFVRGEIKAYNEILQLIDKLERGDPDIPPFDPDEE